MLGTLHHDTYFQRMAAAIGDKRRMEEHLQPGSVLDLGAGDGVFVKYLTSKGVPALGVDASEEAVKRSDDTVILGDVTDLPSGLGKFQNIVASSLFHEVYSYGGGWPAVEATLAQVKEHLLPGGTFILRDGVAPTHSTTPTRARFTYTRVTGDSDQRVPGVEDFFKRFEELFAQVPGGDACNLSLLGHDLLMGDARWMAEFLLTYGWGLNSLEREGLEFYTALGSLDEVAQYFSAETSLDLVFAENYTQKEYFTAWEYVTEWAHYVEGAWKLASFPDSNALWVFRGEE